MSAEAKVGALLVRDTGLKQRVQQELRALMRDDKQIRKFVFEAVMAIKGSEKLMESTELSLLRCIFEAADWGLSLTPSAGQAYMVPFKNKGVLEATLIIGYRGFVTLAERAGIRTDADVVFLKDDFRNVRGSSPFIEHTPFNKNDPDMVQRAKSKLKALGYKWSENRQISEEFAGAYATFRHPDGFILSCFHDRQEIEKRRSRSKAGQDGPWVTDYYAMARKCPIRDAASKLIPHDLAPKLVEVATRDDMRSLGMEVPPAVIETGQTSEEIAAEIAGEQPAETDSGEGARGSSEKNQDIGSDSNGAFKFIEGELCAVSQKRGKGPQFITIRTPDGEEVDLSTFDGGQVRTASELVLTKVRITYTEKQNGDKTYLNIAKGASIERIE